METNKVAYTMLMQSIDEKDKQKNREKYKTEQKEAKLAITKAKTVVFKHFYVEIEGKGGDKKVLTKVREDEKGDIVLVEETHYTEMEDVFF